MEYKLLALDLDDTLLNENHVISPRCFSALQKAAERGIMVTIATGRIFPSALPYALQLGVTLPIIAYHGALIRETTGEKKIFRQKYVPRELALEIIPFLESEGFHVNLYLNDKIFVKEENENTGFYQKVAPVAMNAVGDLSEYLKQEIDEPMKLTVINRQGRLPGLLEKLQEKYGTVLSIAFSRSEFLEITHIGATKGQALKFLAESENLSATQVIAIGDNYNDYDMIQYAGIGVAMGNAPEDVRQAANFVTGANTEDGVALFLENYIL